ncbi:septum site-determining protein MinC [Celerinatantimonas yamalensis]|uniref:Probable septum site-determining protein MinC n=1 Tax=Celerinatantimonas yamalensis TaxID=559956 RepID=A0ABW9G3F6_9GAMM
MASPEVEIKGTTFTISVIHLIDDDLKHVEDVLNHKMAQAPKFFSTAPVIVNVSQVEHPLDFIALKTHIKQTGFVMVGVTGCQNSEQKAQAQDAKIPVLIAGRDVEPKPIEEPNMAQPPRIIRGQVRSGQQVYAKECDLVVIGSVSNGAEIIADGSIHIYGALRGRAIAGANGQTGSVICCQNLQAELVSVAGHYQLSESLQSMWQQACSIELEARQLKIAPLN